MFEFCHPIIFFLNVLFNNELTNRLETNDFFWLINFSYSFFEFLDHIWEESNEDVHQIKVLNIIYGQR